MTLPIPTASISMSQVNVELGLSSTATISFNDAVVRTLTGRTTAGSTVTLPSDFYGKSNIIEAAYWAGGVTSTVRVNTISKLVFSTETSSTETATLNSQKAAQTGVNSATKGYFLGGEDSTTEDVTSDIEGISFVNGSYINPTAVLSVARSGGAGVSSTVKGYVLGGFAAAISAEIDGINFSTEAAINPAAVLAQARYASGGVNSSTTGYALGGAAPAAGYDHIDGIIFSTEAATNPAAVLPTIRTSPAGFNSTTKGYAAGGGQGTYGIVDTVTSIYGFTFSNETASTISAVLATGRRLVCGVNSTTKGYAGGGYVASSGTYVSEIDGITFSTETAINPAAAISGVVRGSIAGAQSGSY